MAILALVLGYFLAASPLPTSGTNDAATELPSVNPGDLPGVEEIPVVCPCIEFSPTVFDCSQHLLETRPDDVTEPYEGMTPSMYLGDEVIDATTGTPPVRGIHHQEDPGQSEVSSQTLLDQHNSGQADTVAIRHDNGVGPLVTRAVPIKKTVRSLDTPQLTKGDTLSLNVNRRGSLQPGSKPGDIPRDDKMSSNLKTVASKFIERIVKETHSTFDVLKRLSLQFSTANSGRPTSTSHLQQRAETTSHLAKDEELPVNGRGLKEATVSDLNRRRKARNILSKLATTGIRQGNGVSTFVRRAGAQKRAIRGLDTPELTETDPPILGVYRRGSSELSSTETLTDGIPSMRDSDMSDSHKPLMDRRDEKMTTESKTVASKFIERIVKDTYSTFDVLRRLTLQFINNKRGRPTSASYLHQWSEATSQRGEAEELPVTGGRLTEVPVSDVNRRRNTRNLLSVLVTTVTRQHDTGVSQFINRTGHEKTAIKTLDTPELTNGDPSILGAYRRGSSQSSSKEALTDVAPTVRGSNVNGLSRPVDHPKHERIPTDFKTIAAKFIERLMRDTHSTFDILRRLTLQFITGNRGRPASTSNIKERTGATFQMATEETTAAGREVKGAPISHLNLHRNSKDIPAIYQTLTDTFPENLIHSYNIHRTLHQGDRQPDGKDVVSDNKENYGRTLRHLVNLPNSFHAKGTSKTEEGSLIDTSISDSNKLRTSIQQKSTSQLQLTVDPKIFPGAAIPDCVPDDVETLYMGATKLGHITNLTFSYLTKLVFLSLNDSGIISISKDTFRNNKHLEELILDWNHVSYLHAFTLQNNPKLRVFSAMMTRLTTIDARFFDHCPQMERVGFSNNLESIPPTLFRNNPLLKHVDLHFNWLADIPESLFFWSPQLESVDLSYNSIVDLSETLFFNSAQLRSANLSHNRMWSLQEDTFSTTPLLEILKLDVNELPVLPPKTLAKLPALKELTLRANHLSHLHEETFTANPELRILDLSYNNIESFPDGIFRHLSKLCHLLLTGNLLTTLGSATFMNNRNLANLNLDVNRISALPLGIFDFTPELKSLHLENNEITFIEVDTFKKIDKLQELDLSTNKLRNLTEVLLAVDDCDNLEKFSLLNNPWICECRNAQYIEVLRKFKTESLYCVSSGGLVYDDFEEIMNEPECTEELENESDKRGEYAKGTENLQ